MSAVSEVHLYCDGEGCAGEREGGFAANVSMGHRTAMEARSWAKGQGWKRRGGKDFCGDCAEEIRKDKAQRANAGLDPLP